VFCGLIAFLFYLFTLFKHSTNHTPTQASCLLHWGYNGASAYADAFHWVAGCPLHRHPGLATPPPFPANGVHIHLWGEGPGIVNVDNGSHVPCPTMTHLNNLANVITWWWHDNVVVSFLLFC